MNIRGPRIPAFVARQIEVGPAGVAPDVHRDLNATREVIRTVFPDNLGTLVSPDGLGHRVAQTVAPWSGIDVFVTPPPFAILQHGVLSVTIWAISQGARSLVSTGRVEPGTYGSADEPTRPVWVAAARGLPDTWEVTAEFQMDPALAIPLGSTLFTVCASNEPADVPEGIGAISFGSAIGMVQGGARAAFVQAFGFWPGALKLLSISAINGAAAPRFLHLHDLTSPLAAAVAGQVPLFAFPMGAAIGGGVVVPEFNYRSRDFLLAVVSSTLGTTTQVADGLISGLVS